jgi:gliding motility-associated-like protein
VVNVSCNGLCDGSASATASSGTPPYTYSISGPGVGYTIDPNTGVASNLCAGNYVITVTDDNSCVGTVNVNITEPSAILPSAITTNTSCFGVCDGTAIMSSTGGSGGYVYTILPTGPFGPIVAGNNISGLCANTVYTVTSTDINSCTGTMTIQISQPAQLILNVVSTQDVSCNGGCDGEATLSFAGGTGAVTYSINPVIPCLPLQAVSGTFTNLGANTYTVTGTDANGCIATVSFVINQPPVFSISANVTQNVSCNGGCDGEVVLTPNGGTPGYSYSISPITPCLPAQAVSGTFTNLGANTYTVTGTDANGCTTTVSFTIVEPNAPVTSLVSSTPPTCTPGCDGTATMTTIGGTPGYTYTVNPAATVNVNVISGLCAGTIYTVTSTDNNGCAATETVILNAPNSPVINIASSTNPSCAPGCDGTATYTIAGGTGPYSASINNGASITVGPNQISGLCTGIIYTITITDANSCSGVTTIQLFEPAGPAINVVSTTDASCIPGCDGTATLNPAAGIIYSINPAAGAIAGNVINGLCSGTTYTVTGTDANGCTGTTTVQVGTLPSTPPVVASTTDATCSPGCDGTATMTIIPGMSYSISPAAGTIVGNVINGLCANTIYTITGTNAAGCTATTTEQVGTLPSTQPVVASTTDASCSPGCDGTATMTIIPGMTYTISPAAGTIVGNVINGLCANTTYTITGTNAAGCTSIVTTTVQTLNGPSVLLGATADASCLPGCDGQATFIPSGGTPGYTYLINPAVVPGFAGNTVTGLCANVIYTVTLSDAALCSVTTTVSVNVAQGPPIDTISTTPAGCNPSCNGTATMTPVGLTYTISPAAGAIVGNVINGLCAGTTYIVTGTDANGCTNTTSFQIGTTPNPTLNVTSTTNISIAGGNNGSITVAAAGGTPAYVYSIIPNIGTQAPAGTFNNLTAQCYTIIVTDSKGCTFSATACLSEPGACSLTINNLVNVNCFGQSTGSFTASAAGGSGSFNYNINNGGTINLTTGAASNLSAASYTVTATDNLAGGCVVTTVVVITQNPDITFNAPVTIPPTCVPGCDGTLTISAVGGNGSITYSISNASVPCAVLQPSAGNFTGLGNATYTITATDGLGCTKTITVTLAPLAGPSFTGANTSNVSCNGLCNGTASMLINGGSGVISYTISPNSPCVPVQATPGNFTGLGANTYTVIATDANGCSAQTTFTITQPPVLSIGSFASTDPACNGNSNGTATITGAGGTGVYGYTISPAAPGVGGNFTGLSGGVTYTITVTDGNQCSVTSSFTLNNPTSLTWVNFAYTDILCAGQNNGTISACAQGGTGVISYTLNAAAIANCNITNLSANTYTVVATDAAGCFISTIVTIVEPPLLVMSAPSVVNALCNGQASGSITTSAVGGNPGYTFSIAPAVVAPNTTGVFNNIPAGNYVVTVTDASGCTSAFNNVQVSQPAPIQITAVNIQNVACYGAATGSITITAQGGTGVINFGINPPANQTSSGFFTGLAAGSYVITATDANGCTLQTTGNVTQNPQITVAALTLTEPICHGDANGIIDVTATGGFPPIQYALDGPPFQNNGLFNAVIAGPHTITFQDILGCTRDTVIILTEPQPVGALVTLRDAVCIDSEDGQAIVVGTGGRGGYKYYVTPGLYINKSGVFNGLAAGTYTLRVVDTAGCEYSNIFTINPPANPLTNIVTKLDLACHGKGNEGQATANASGGATPYTYFWSTEPPQVTATAQTLYFGTYYVDVTDANGCKVRDTVYIEEGPCCDIAFIPNAFSPNGDGNNDEFKVLTTAGVELIQLEIRDRWGKRVWSTNDYRRGWDGTFEGRDSDPNTYYYVLRYKCTRDGSTYMIKGDVILIR